MQDPQVSVNIKQGRNIVRSGIVSLDVITKRIMNMGNSAYEASAMKMDMIEQLRQGKTFSYSDNHKGEQFRITVKPLNRHIDFY